MNGTDYLLMILLRVTPACQSILNNPGHPFLALWAASGPTVPLVIAVLPDWFDGGGGLTTYVPGASLSAS